MPLPVKELPTATIDIDGTAVEYRALSREEALRLNEFVGRENEAEVSILVWSTGCTEDEAREFRAKNLTATAGELIDAILLLSGLTSPEALAAAKLRDVSTLEALKDADPNS